jgi:hypothetical protein
LRRRISDLIASAMLHRPRRSYYRRRLQKSMAMLAHTEKTIARYLGSVNLSIYLLISAIFEVCDRRGCFLSLFPVPVDFSLCKTQGWVELASIFDSVSDRRNSVGYSSVYLGRN